MKNIIVIVGPTAVGKTKLSVELAIKYNAEIINADSTQVYRELNIGTAKIKNDETKGIKHHLIDIRSVEENYSVFDFQKDCRKKIEEITNRNKKVIIVGGTGLYLKAALFDYNFSNTNEYSQDMYKEYDNDYLYEKLKKIDYEASLNIHKNNRKRLVRALFLAENGVSKTSQLEKQKHVLLYDVDFIGLSDERDSLYNKINERFDVMFSHGLIEEARNLYNIYGDKSFNAFQAIGYKELFSYFDNKIELEEAKELIKKKTRNYAKRQYTWFNNQFDVEWFKIDRDFFENTINEVEKFLER